MVPSMPELDRALSSGKQRQWVDEQGIATIPTHILLWKDPGEAPEI